MSAIIDRKKTFLNLAAMDSNYQLISVKQDTGKSTASSAVPEMLNLTHAKHFVKFKILSYFIVQFNLNLLENRKR